MGLISIVIDVNGAQDIPQLAAAVLRCVSYFIGVGKSFPWKFRVFDSQHVFIGNDFKSIFAQMTIDSFETVLSKLEAANATHQASPRDLESQIQFWKASTYRILEDLLEVQGHVPESKDDIGNYMVYFSSLLSGSLSFPIKDGTATTEPQKTTRTTLFNSLATHLFSSQVQREIQENAVKFLWINTAASSLDEKVAADIFSIMEPFSGSFAPLSLLANRTFHPKNSSNWFSL